VNREVFPCDTYDPITDEAAPYRLRRTSDGRRNSGLTTVVVTTALRANLAML